jgi:hypothetical protein
MRSDKIRIDETYRACAPHDHAREDAGEPWLVTVLATRQPREIGSELVDGQWVPKITWDGVLVECTETSEQLIVSSRDILAPAHEAAEREARLQAWSDARDAAAKAKDEHASARHALIVQAIERAGGDASLLGEIEADASTVYMLDPQAMLQLLQGMGLIAPEADAHMVVPEVPVHPDEADRLAREFARPDAERDAELADMARVAAAIMRFTVESEQWNAEQEARGMRLAVAPGAHRGQVQWLCGRAWGMSRSRTDKLLGLLSAGSHVRSRREGWSVTDTGRALVGMFEIIVPPLGGPAA